VQAVERESDAGGRLAAARVSTPAQRAPYETLEEPPGQEPARSQLSECVGKIALKKE